MIVYNKKNPYVTSCAIVSLSSGLVQKLRIGTWYNQL